MFEELKKAKENVRWLLDHESGLVDMHGIGFWAIEVERLREAIKREL